MARQRYRKRDDGLFAIAVRSDWKVSVALAAGSLFVGVVIAPLFFAASPFLRPIGAVFTQLAWLVAFGFACIALIRYLKQASDQLAANPFQREIAGSRQGAPTGNRSGRTEPMLVRTPAPNAPAASAKPVAPASPQRPESWSLDVLDRVEWKRFEDLCCAFYREKGIRAETTRLGADGGIDIRLFQDDSNPTRATSIVQCKAWNKPVGVKEVRELRGVMAHEKVEKAFFMAPNGYTDDARAFATENRITLLDGKLFLAMLLRLPENASKRLLEFATAGDWTTPTCPSCGGRMTARDSKRGAFWGCVTFPKCRGKLPMRASAKS